MMIINPFYIWFFQGHTAGIMDLEFKPRSKPNIYHALCPKKSSCQKKRGEDGEHHLFAKVQGYQDFTDFQRWC